MAKVDATNVAHLQNNRMLNDPVIDFVAEIGDAATFLGGASGGCC